MTAACYEPITYIDAKGYIYCTKHGRERQQDQQCRKLRQHELNKLDRGEQVERY